MKALKGFRVVRSLDEDAEAYAVVSVDADGSVVELVGKFAATPADAKKALNLRDVAVRADAYDGRYGGLDIQVYAVRHDCDENAVPYVSDGPLGHGWECGTCGGFLQAG